MRSFWEFVAIAAVVTVTPGPATATIVRVAGRHGRRAATHAIAGNSAGVLLWGALSAVGISSLILASHVAYDALRAGGAIVLLWLGLRTLLGRESRAEAEDGRPLPSGWRAGLVTSVSNPKLATFFVALFPQFLRPGTAVLPLALAMASTIVLFDLAWYSALVLTIDRARTIVRPRLGRAFRRASGVVMVGFGAKLAAELR